MKSKPSFFKRSWITLLAYFLLLAAIHAQSDCMVRYNYDNAGNRVKRYWYCFGEGGEEKANSATNALEKNGLTIYPVPADSRIDLRLDMPIENALVEVSDGQGKVLITQRMNGSGTQLNISSLSNGMYHLRVIKDSAYFLSSFIVQR